MTPGAIAMRGVARALLQSLLAAIVATLLVGGGLLLAGRDPLAVLTTLVTGALADPYRIAEALGRSCPLLLCGLAVAVAFRAQAWNIGVEGQYLLGAIAATAIGVNVIDAPGTLLIPTMLAAGAAAGTIWALPAALLEIRRGVPLVLGTILLNFVAVGLVSYLTQGPLRGSDPSAAQSDPIASQAFIPALVRATDLHAGVPLAFGIAIVLWILLGWSTPGFAVRVTGSNPIAAAWMGIRVPRVQLGVMAISGALGGLAGAMQIAAVNHLLNIQASEGFGYVGIAVALLGRLHPLGVAVAAVLIGLLDVGAAAVERRPQLAVPSDIAQVIKGVVILTVVVFASPRWRAWRIPRPWRRAEPAGGAA